MSVLQVSIMLQWLKNKRLKLPTNIILSIALAILIVTPAQADVTGNETFLPHCVKVTNLEKYPKYQIIARVSDIPRPNQKISFKDVTMSAGSCVDVSYKQKINLYAIDKGELGTPQPNFISGNVNIPYYYKYTSDNSELPWYISDVQDELQIVEITPSNLNLKQNTIYHYNYLFWALAFAAAVILIITLIFRRIWKVSKNFDP
jgi:hypothetical protein